MKLEEFRTHLKELNDAELMELIHDIRRNREQSMSVTRVKAVKKKAAGKNIKAAFASLTDEQKKALIAKFSGG